jgi:hypothetical protein
MSDSVYRERARLVAHLAAIYPSAMDYSDPSEPDWAVVIIKTSEGQMSWHIAPDDIDLFDHVDRSMWTWDGHSTEQKYERLARLTRIEAS